MIVYELSKWNNCNKVQHALGTVQHALGTVQHALGTVQHLNLAVLLLTGSWDGLKAKVFNSTPDPDKPPIRSVNLPGMIAWSHPWPCESLPGPHTATRYTALHLAAAAFPLKEETWQEVISF